MPLGRVPPVDRAGQRRQQFPSPATGLDSAAFVERIRATHDHRRRDLASLSSRDLERPSWMPNGPRNLRTVPRHPGLRLLGPRARHHDPARPGDRRHRLRRQDRACRGGELAGLHRRQEGRVPQGPAARRPRSSSRSDPSRQDCVWPRGVAPRACDRSLAQRRAKVEGIRRPALWHGSAEWRTEARRFPCARSRMPCGLPKIVAAMAHRSRHQRPQHRSLVGVAAAGAYLNSGGDMPVPLCSSMFDRNVTKKVQRSCQS